LSPVVRLKNLIRQRSIGLGRISAENVTFSGENATS
jgi:hypothetical protein